MVDNQILSDSLYCDSEIFDTKNFAAEDEMEEKEEDPTFLNESH
jgi:hypothetical protein